jgi:hypothetical protein
MVAYRNTRRKRPIGANSARRKVNGQATPIQRVVGLLAGVDSGAERLCGDFGGIDLGRRIGIESDTVIAREPLVETSGGLLGGIMAGGEGTTQDGTDRLPRPPIGGAANFDVATAFDVEAKFGENPTEMLVVQQQQTPAMLPDERSRGAMDRLGRGIDCSALAGLRSGLSVGGRHSIDAVRVVRTARFVD